MTVKRFFTGTLALLLWAIGLQGVAFLYDLVFNVQLSSPVWDATYNWLPFAAFATTVSAAATGLRLYAEKHRILLKARSYRLPGDRAIQYKTIS